MAKRYLMMGMLGLLTAAMLSSISISPADAKRHGWDNNRWNNGRGCNVSNRYNAPPAHYYRQANWNRGYYNNNRYYGNNGYYNNRNRNSGGLLGFLFN